MIDKIMIKRHIVISPFEEVELNKKQILDQKKQLLRQMRKHVYCGLMPSKISGVGVFTIRDIPAGIDPFQEPEDIKWIPFSKKELTKIHPNVLQMIRELYVFSDGAYWIPVQCIQTFCIVQFLNHSKNPNLTIDKDGEIIVTKRKIKEGEELTVNYRSYDDEAEEKIKQKN
ncbi:MAG: SET domain-containing protein-lysine N-methyltransferase [bacterium]|nr:SET domain-containing protein-lysine N-methyltransferase [bacterium]